MLAFQSQSVNTQLILLDLLRELFLESTSLNNTFSVLSRLPCRNAKSIEKGKIYLILVN